MVTKTKPRTKKPTTAPNHATKTTKTISAKKTGGAKPMPTAAPKGTSRPAGGTKGGKRGC